MAVLIKHLLVVLLLLQFPILSGADEDDEDVEASQVTQTAEAEPAEEKEKEEEGWTTEQMKVTHHNIQVVRDTWDYIKVILKADGVDERTLEEFTVQPIAITMELVSEDEFVLKNRLNHRLQFLEGGGDLDFFNYVVGKGPFNVRFSPHLTDNQKFHMIYISDSPKKEVDGVSWGNSCRKIYDLTKEAKQFIMNNGMKVTSSRRHYLHLLAGTFIFFQLIDDKLHLGYIRVMDSRYPQFNCKNAG